MTASRTFLTAAKIDPDQKDYFTKILDEIDNALTVPGVTATAAELNTLAGVTAGTAAASSAVVLDANLALDVVRTATLRLGASGAEVAVSATAAELNYLDIAVPGTGAASKAVVLDADDDYTWPAAGILTFGVLKDPAGTTLGATAAEINARCDVSSFCQSIDASGAAVIAAGSNNVLLNHVTQITATIANANTHVGLFTIKAKLEPATTHTVTLTAGTWDGTNTIATFTDILDGITVMFDADGNGTIINNTGAVTFS